MLIDKNEYRNSLADLWHEVFGDDYSFIDLIFKSEYDKAVLCFAEIDGTKAVSAFYLIENELYFENKRYKGYYLYAAATLPEYRKGGLMSKLIAEAQNYCRENGIDFISLLPSEESLYLYYSRFGFQKAMYRIESKVNNLNKLLNKNEILDDTDVIYDIRSKYKGNMINFSRISFGYAVDCLDNADFEFISVSDDSYLLISDKGEISEFISSAENLSENLKKASVDADTMVSPFPISDEGCNDIKPFGMLYPINRELIRDWKHTDIYMNIALD